MMKWDKIPLLFYLGDNMYELYTKYYEIMVENFFQFYYNKYLNLNRINKEFKNLGYPQLMLW